MNQYTQATAIIDGDIIFSLPFLFSFDETEESKNPNLTTQDTGKSLELRDVDTQHQHLAFPIYDEEDILKWLEAEELDEFFVEWFELVTQISEGKRDIEALSIFLSEWRETALINSEPEVLADIVEAEQELDAGGGKPWSQIKKEIGL